MSLFDWLLVCHLVGDYMIQRQFQAHGKTRDGFFNLALFSHSLEYTLVFLPLVLVGKVSYVGVLILFVSHYLIDRRFITEWWMKKVKGLKPEDFTWLKHVVDQTFHILILVIVAVYAGR